MKNIDSTVALPDEIFTVEFWRKETNRMIGILEAKGLSWRTVARNNDPFFRTSEGEMVMNAHTSGRASLLKTKKIAEALLPAVKKLILKAA